MYVCGHFCSKKVACLSTAWWRLIQMQWCLCNILYGLQICDHHKGCVFSHFLPCGLDYEFSLLSLSSPVVDLDQMEGFVPDWKHKINSNVCRHSFTLMYTVWTSPQHRDLGYEIYCQRGNRPTTTMNTFSCTHCAMRSLINSTKFSFFKLLFNTNSLREMSTFHTFTHCCYSSQPGLVSFSNYYIKWVKGSRRSKCRQLLQFWYRFHVSARDDLKWTFLH